jgi:hypothetical protein
LTNRTVKVVDGSGGEVGTLVDGIGEARYKSVQFDASNLASGVHYYRLTAGNFAQTKKLLLRKTLSAMVKKRLGSFSWAFLCNRPLKSHGKLEKAVSSSVTSVA